MNNKWILKSAKTIGRAHLRENPPIPCQDSVFTMQKDGVSVIALSDGCGSSCISELGADITTKTLCELFTSFFDELYSLSELEIKKMVVNSIIEEIQKFINNNPRVLENFAKKDPNHHRKIISNWPGFKNAEKLYPITIFDATVQFVAEKNGKAIIGRLGDGVIVSVINGNICIQSMEDKVGVEENATWYPSTINIALENPRINPWEHFDIQKIEDSSNYSMFFIVSDGLGDAIVGSDLNKKFIYPEDVYVIFKKDDLFDILEKQYKPMRGIFDDLSISVMHKNDLEIKGLVMREYDSHGVTIRNNVVENVNISEIEEQYKDEITEDTVSSIPTIQSVEETHIFDIVLDQKYIDALNKYIKNDNNKLTNVLEMSSKTYEYLKAKKIASFNEIVKLLEPHVELIDVQMYAAYWDKIKLFDVDRRKEIVKMR